MIKRIFSALIFCLATALGLIPQVQAHPWNIKIPLNLSQDYHVVVKGFYPTLSDAKNIQNLIQTTLKDIPGDAVVKSELFANLPKGQWVVASLFDTKERAQWWIKFSTRNPRVPKATIYQSKLLAANIHGLPYFPDARMANDKFISELEAIALVKKIPDVLALAKKHGRLDYLIIDYPRSGDLRYEIEVLKPGGVMYDFFMVDAVNKRVSERYSAIFRPTKTASQ